MITIEDLLKTLQNPFIPKASLKNTKETWSRIGKREEFEELGLESSELESFLAEWISENSYCNIS